MQDETSVGSMTIEDRLSRAEGRKARRHSATAKLTREEHDRIAGAAKAERKALSEWCREALLAAVRGEAVTPTFTEVVAIRQLLNSTLEAIACGEKVTHEKFQTDVQTIRRTKHKAAAEVMQQYNVSEVAK